MLPWLLDLLRDEAKVIKGAPFAFAIIVLLCLLIAFFVVKAVFKDRLDNAKDLLAFYKEKSSISEFTPQKVTAIKEAWGKTEKIAVVGKTFRSEEVPLDGRSYSNCTFENVKLLFNGDAPFDLNHNHFNGGVVFTTKSPAIGSVLVTLNELGYLKTTKEWAEYWDKVNAGTTPPPDKINP